MHIQNFKMGTALCLALSASTLYCGQGEPAPDAIWAQINISETKGNVLKGI